MAKQLNVNLAFTSDTSKVKQDLQELQNTLSRLTANSAQKSPLGITADIKNAISDVAKLEVALKKATTSTGTLNLGQFKTELNQAGLTAEKISVQLRTLGADGVKAFSQLTSSIMSASLPLRQTGTLLSSFATTLKNTARWQISSALLHGFMGSIQTAYHYAEDLNKSLNNIRIVTGKSTDEMADFAKEANEAAQALSTTTTDYTNASLIYYQQGLDDEAVKERTDATVKMANVTRESAEEVSQQMTAIWNNFDDGSKSLEYYSDVITALGAATASSSAEISQGLEKFAAVADTVGLSYEYATAALATVTATTRQSADVVGNAFKTLFARIEGLKLGETLDDGTDLNKYSKALAAVGINIKETDGQLKEMDQILEELGARWKTLAKDQQMALAQTVAGVRQYTQLIALMDNWDFFEQNVRVAEDAEGTLDKQFKIYEEGWEAAQKRFTSAMQNIYTQILNDDFFIDLTNSFTKIVQSIGRVIDSFEGLKGLLPGISALLLKIFGSDISAAMDRFVANIRNSTQSMRESFIQEREAFVSELTQVQSDDTIAGSAIANVYQRQGEAQTALIQKVRELQAENSSLTEQQQLQISNLMDYNNALGEIKIKEAERLQSLQLETEELQKQTLSRAKDYSRKDSDFNLENFERELNILSELEPLYQRLNIIKEQYDKSENKSQAIENIERINEELTNLIGSEELATEQAQALQTAFENLIAAKNGSPEQLTDAYDKFCEQLKRTKELADETRYGLEESIKGSSTSAKELTKSLNNTTDSCRAMGKAQNDAAQAGNNFTQVNRGVIESIDGIEKQAISASQRFVAFGSTLSSFAMSLQSINSIYNTINNPDLSAWEKFVNITMSLGFLIPSVIRTFSQLNTMLGAQSGLLSGISAKHKIHLAEKELEKANNIAIIAQEEAMLAIEKAQIALKEYKNSLLAIENKNTAEYISYLAALIAGENLNISAMEKENGIRAIENFLKETGYDLDKKYLAVLYEGIIAKELDGAAFTKLAIQESAQIGVEELDIIVTEKLAKAKKKLLGSILATNPALLIMIGIVAVLGTGLFIYNKRLENVIESQKKMADQSSEIAEKSRDELEANQELVFSYEELVDKYKKGEIGKSELYDTTNKLAEAYNIEGAAIANLTGQYDEFTQKVKEASAAELERQKRKEKNAFKENAKGMWAAGTTGKGFIFDQGESYAYDVGSVFDFDVNAEDISNAIYDVTGSHSTQLRIENRNDPQQVLKYYENLQKIRDRLINEYDISESSGTIMNIDEELEQMSSYYEQAIEHLNNYNQLLLQEISNTNDIVNVENVEQVQNIADQMEKKLRLENPNMSEDEINDLIDEYLLNLNNNIINRFLTQKELISEGVSEEVAQAFANLDLSNAEIEAMVNLGFKVDYYKTEEELNQAVKDFKNLLQKKQYEASIPINLSVDINETVLKGKTVNKETWEELTAAVPNAEEILGDRDEFNNTSVAERIRLLKELNEVLYQQSKEIAEVDEKQKESYKNRSSDLEKQIKDQQKLVEELIPSEKNNYTSKFNYSDYSSYDEYKEAIKNAEKELNKLTEEQERLNELINGMSDAGVAALENVINSLLSDISFVKEGTELIGDNWTVAAENVEQFVRLMPEIISDQEQLNFLEDGSLKLTESQVALVLNANNEIINSNKEVVIASIQNKIDQLEIENEYYKKQIARLKDSLQHHQNYDENIKEMDKNTQEYADQLKELGVQVDSSAWEKMVGHSADGADAIQQNLEKIYNRIQEIHDAYGKMLTTDELGGFNIEGVTKTSLGDSEWRADVSAEDIDSFWEDKAVIFQEQIDQYQKSIEENEDLIAQYTGAIAKIKSGANEVGKAIDRVNSGKAGKESKSKGGSSKDPDKKDHTDDEVDKYYEIENAIAEINHQLEINEQIQKRLSTYQNHYAGKTLIASLKKQNDLLKERNGILEKQYKNYEKLYEIQLKELGELKGKIGGNWNGNELQNYAELMQANIDKYNAVIDTYNAMSADQQKSTGKEMVEDAKKVYDKYKKALEDYQDLYYNKMYDTENKLNEMRQQQLENQFKIIENNLKGWETEIELKLDMTKMKREWKAFIHDVEQDFRKIYENLSLNSILNKHDFDTYIEDAETRLKQIADVEAELRKMDASKDANGVVQLSDDYMFGSISEAQEYLKKLQTELVDVGNSLNDMYEQVWDNYIKGLDQAKDNFEDINKEIEHLTNMLDYEKELIELIYGEKAYDMMSRYYSAQTRSIETQIDSTRQQAAFWEDQFNKAFEMNKEKHNVSLEDMSTWTEDMKKAYDEMIEAQEKLNDLVIKGIETLRDDYLNNIAKTLQEMDKAIWGMDFDDLKEDWDFIQKKADEYLDDVEGAYKIQALANKIDDSIAEASSLKAQQKLAKLREDEINMLREKEHLTQDDIDLAEARYQIALKEMALEDAQNNKTSMKLTRDTSGNWTYQYVADEEDVTNKQQELLDAYNNLYEIADNAYNHAMELAMEMYEEYKDKLVQIAEDTTLAEEEKLLKMQELRDQYMPEIVAAMENAQVYEQETIMATAAVFAEVCEQDADAYTTLTDLQKELVDMVRDQHLEDYEEIRDAILNNYQEIGDKAKETFEETNLNSQTAASDIIAQWDLDDGASVKGAMNDAFDSVIKYTKNFENELYNLEIISGRTIMDPGGVVSDVDAIGQAIDEVAYKTEEMANKSAANLDNLRGFVNEVENAWEEVINKIQEAINALQEYLAMTEAVANAEMARQAEVAAQAAAAEAANAVSSNSGNGSSGGSNKGTAGVERKSSIYQGVTDPYGARNTWAVKNTKTGEYEEISGNKEYLEKKYGVIFNSGWNSYMHFATGGYTGDWDSQSGKLAVLHEKELVLNASDTENMLSAVNIIRDIAGLNQSIGETIANSISGLIMKAINTGNTNINTTTNDNTNNVFHINAEFPNVNDVQTIRDAILSLPNIASQYVHAI